MKNDKERTTRIDFFLKVMLIVFWVVGVIAAFNGDLAVALFFAIFCAGESIGCSIDKWPKNRN